MNLEIKDALYYEDLIYEIKRLANFEQIENEEISARIALRSEEIVEEQEAGPIRIAYRLSAFQEELFKIVRGISQKAGVNFTGLRQISNYPTFVQEVLCELEIKKNNTINEDTIEEVCATSNNHNTFIVSAEKSAEFLAQKPNPENNKQRKKVLNKVNIRTDRK